MFHTLTGSSPKGPVHLNHIKMFVSFLTIFFWFKSQNYREGHLQSSINRAGEAFHYDINPMLQNQAKFQISPHQKWQKVSLFVLGCTRSTHSQ